MQKQAGDISALTNKRIIITGGAGFIGSTLARRLCGLGNQVVVIDCLIPEFGGNLHNLKDIDGQLTINLSDVRDPFSLRPLLKEADFLFNLAGQTSHLDSMTDPQTDLSINCSAQINLLEICRDVNPEIRVVYASTRQIYGHPDYLPVDENHSISPVDINGIHKYAAEEYHKIYHRNYGIKSCILRLTNTIGPRMRIRDARQTFVGIWIRQLLEHKPIEVWGGEQLRDFNDVEDVVDALILSAQEPDCIGETFNLGSEEKISLIDLAKLMISLHGSGELNIKDFPEDRKKIDIGDYYSNHEKFSRLTGWNPERSLRQTLERTLAYYQANFAAYTE